jgi:hypothetical protein
MHTFCRVEDLHLFIAWLDSNFDYYGWAKHLEMLLRLAENPDKLIIRYEDFMAGPTALEKVA